ncbi:UNVERIFIED_CONTAM: hypothetical protein BJ099_102130 [Lysinibacillus xylanilyticus]
MVLAFVPLFADPQGVAQSPLQSTNALSVYLLVCHLMIKRSFSDNVYSEKINSSLLVRIIYRQTKRYPISDTFYTYLPSCHIFTFSKNIARAGLFCMFGTFANSTSFGALNSLPCFCKMTMLFSSALLANIVSGN